MNKYTTSYYRSIVPVNCNRREDFHKAFLFLALGANIVPIDKYSQELRDIILNENKHWRRRATEIEALALKAKEFIGDEEYLFKWCRAQIKDYSAKLTIIKKYFES